MPEEDNSLDASSASKLYDATSSSLETTAPVVQSIPARRRPSLFKFNRLAFTVTGGALAAIAIIVGIAFLFNQAQSSKASELAKKKGSYDVSTISTNGVQQSDALKVGTADSLDVNGQLQVSNTVVLTPTSAPTTPEAGQIYYDKTLNSLFYYNGSVFVPVANQNSVVSSLGGLTGAINPGAGLSAVGGSLQNTGVLTVQGQTGNVTFTAGGGVEISGTTISTVALPAGQLVLGTGTNGFTTVAAASMPGQCLVSTSGAPVFGSCTGTTQVTSLNGLVNGLTLSAGAGINITDNGSNAITITSTAGAAITQINGQTGPTLTVANATAASNIITINNALANGSTKGIAAFNATNFTASSGVINTIQDIATSSSPSFTNLTTSGYVKTTELRNATDVVFTLPVTGSGASRTLCYVDDGNNSNCPTGGNVSYGSGGGENHTPGTVAMFTSSGIADSYIIQGTNILNINAGITLGGSFGFTGVGTGLTALNATSITTGSLAVANGGTGATSFSQYQLVVGGASGLESIPTGSINQCLLSGGPAANPQFTACPVGGNVSTNGSVTDNYLTKFTNSGDITDSTLLDEGTGLQVAAASYYLDLADASTSTLTVKNSTSGQVANLDVTGKVTAGTGFVGDELKSSLPNGAGNDLKITSENNNIVFSINGGSATFTFATTGGTDQIICTSGISCASGGGQAVLLMPDDGDPDHNSIAQDFSGARTGIWLNQTSGGGDIFRLQRVAKNALVVDSNGYTTLGNITTTAGQGLQGKLTFSDGSVSGYGLTLQAGTLSNDVTINLPTSTGNAGNNIDEVCLRYKANCTSSGGGASNFINNDVALQTSANFNIQSASTGAVTAVIQQLTGQTADLLQLKDSGGFVEASFSNAGNILTLGHIGVTGNNPGQLVLADGTTSTFSVTLQVESGGLANNTVLSLPNDAAATDTICLKNLANCTSGSGGGSSFINNQITEQVDANYYIHSVSGEVAAKIRGDDTAQDILQLLSNGGTVVAKIDASGNLTAVDGNFSGNFAQSGTGTFGTGTGAVSLNGDVTVASNKNVSITGSGTLTVGTGLTTLGGGLTVSAGNLALTAGLLSTGGTTRLTNAGALSNITGYGQSSGNFLQSGSGTFGTGTGAVSLNGDTTVAAGKLLTAASINTTAGANTTLGNATGTFALASTGLNVTTAGALSGISGYAQASGNFLQSGSGTFGTGTGAVSLNGDTTVASGKLLTAANINTTALANTTLGNATGTFGLASTGLNVTTAGALSGISGYAQASGNFLQSGSGTFGTGTGAVSLNGDTTVTNGVLNVGTGATAGSLKLATTSGSSAVTISAVARTGNLALSIPTDPANPATDTFCLQTLGNCSGAGASSVGAIDGGTPDGNGAQIASNVLYLQYATALLPGLVSVGTQSFAGAKTFTGNLLQSGSTTFGTGTGAVSLNGSTTVTNGVLNVGQGATAGSLKLATTSGSSAVTISAVARTGNLALSIPTDPLNPASDTLCLQTLGNCSGAGASAVGALNGGTANANGATIASNVLYLQSASTSFAGLVDTTIQSFAGAKTFNALGTFSAGLTSTGATNINTSGSAVTNINTGSGSGAVTIGNSTGNTAITLDSGTAAINIGTGAQARSVNLGTGAAAQTVTVGSTNGASALTLQGGTGGINLNPSGTSDTGVIIKPLADSAGALKVQNATGTTLLNVNTNNNLIINPSFEADATNWTNVTRVVGSSAHGTAYGSVSALGNIQSVTANFGSYTANTPHTFSFYAKGVAASQEIKNNTFDVFTICTISINSPNTWTKYSCSFTPGFASQVMYIQNKSGGAVSYLIDGVKLEQGSSLTPTVDNLLSVNSNSIFKNQTDNINAFQIQNAAGNNIFNVDTVNTAITVKSATNNTTAFQIQNAAGSDIFTVDTTNSKIGTANGTTSNVLTIKSGDASAGASGVVTLASGTGTTSTGAITVSSGNASAGTSGAHTVSTGTGTTGTGILSLQSGNASAGPSGNFTLQSGTGTTGTGTGSLLTGNASAGASGALTVRTGTGTTGTGALTISTGNSSTAAGTSGALTIDTGSTNAGTSGNISIGTGAYAHNTTIGNATGSSTITLQSGTGGIVASSTATTGNAMALTANALTTGNGLNITTNSLLNTSGNLLNVNQSGSFTQGISMGSTLNNVSRTVTADTSPSVILDNATNFNDVTTWSHTIGNYTNRALFVSVIALNGSGAPSCTVTYGGAPMTAVKTVNKVGANYYFNGIFELIAPNVGTASVVASCTGSGSKAGTSSSWYNVDQNYPFADSVSSVANVSPNTVTVPSTTTRDYVVDSFISPFAGPTVGGGQTVHGSYTGSSYRFASYKPGANTSTDMTWTTGNTGDLTHVAVPVKALTPSTLAISGALSNFSSNCTLVTGTCTDTSNILNLNQQYASASGAVLNIQNAGTGADIQIGSAGTGKIQTAAGTTSNGISLLSGNASAGASGTLTLATGTGTTNTGAITLASGAGTSASGAVTVTTGNVSAGTSGAHTVSTGTGTTGTGILSLQSGNASAGPSGNFTLQSGTGTTGTGTGSLLTGNASAGASGALTVRTGTGTTGTGALTISTGNSSTAAGTSGALTIDTGSTNAGTSGNISIGTGAYAHNTTIGNATGSSTITLQSGTGGIAASSTATTGTAMALTANALTTGNGVNITTNSINLTSGNLVNISQASTYTGNATLSGSTVSVARNSVANTSPNVTLDNINIGTYGNFVTNISWNHTVNNYSNGALVVTVGAYNTAAGVPTCTVNYGSAPMAQLVSQTGVGSFRFTSMIFGLTNPTVGTDTVSVSCNYSAGTLDGSSSSWYNVDQTTSFAGANSANTTGSPVNLTVSGTTTRDKVVDQWVGQDGSRGIGGGQTGYGVTGWSSYKDGASSSTTMTSTTSGTRTVTTAVAIKPTASGTLTQSSPATSISSNCTVTTGSCVDTGNVLNLNQQYASATGAVLNIQNSGTGADIQLGGGTIKTANGTTSTAASLLTGNASAGASGALTVSTGTGTTGTGALTISTGNSSTAAGTSGALTLSTGTTNAGTGGNINISPNGAGNTGVIVKPTNDSTAAFRVQNAGGVNLLSADTANLRVSVGGKGTATGQLYVSGQTPSAVLASSNGQAASFGLDIQGRYAYTTPTGTTGGLQVYDISNPASVTQFNTAVTTLGTASKRVKVQGKYAFVAGWLSSTNGVLEAYDISNPKAPTRVGSVNYTASNNTPALYVQGRYAYVGDNGQTSLSVIDITNPASMSVVGTPVTLSTGAVDIVAQGRYVYVANSTFASSFKPLQIIDMSNPASPSIVGSITESASNTPISGAAASLAVQGAYAYIGTATGNLYVIDIKDPTTPAVSTSLTGLGSNLTSIVAQSRYLYVGDLSLPGIRTVDISIPASATAVSGTVAAQSPQRLVAAGRYLYVANNSATNTLQSFDMGGTYDQQLEAGGAEIDTLNVRGNATFANDASIQGSLTVGTNASIQGDMAVTGGSKFSGNLTGNNYATSTATYSTTVGASSSTTSVVVNSVTGFAAGDVIFIDNAGQDYFTRITAINGGTKTFTVTPAVDVDANSGATPAVTKYVVQSIGSISTSAATPALGDRFFQGYFLGGVVTGAGSTTLSDNNLQSTGKMNYTATGHLFTSTATTTSGLSVAANSLTTGSALSVSTSSGTLTSGSVASISQTNTYNTVSTLTNNVFNVSRTITTNAPQPQITLDRETVDISGGGFNFDAGSNPNTVVLVSISNNASACPSPTYGGTALTQLACIQEPTSNSRYHYLGYVMGKNGINALANTGSSWATHVVSYYNVGSVASTGQNASFNCCGSPASSLALTPTTLAANEKAVDFIGALGGPGTTSPTGTGETQSGTKFASGSYIAASGITSTVGSVTQSWSATGVGNGWAITGAKLSPVTTPATTNSGALASFSSNCVVGTNACSDSAVILNLNQQYASATGTVLNITNSGAGNGISVTNAGTGTSLLANNTSTGKSIDIQSGGTSVFSISNSASAEGAALFRNKTNNAAAFNIQNASGSSLLNISTLPVVTPGSLISNGSFETDTSGWTNLSRVNSGASDGSYSGYTSTTGSVTATATLSSSLLPSTTYTLSYYMSGMTAFTGTFTPSFAGQNCTTQNWFDSGVFTCTLTTPASPTYNTVGFTLSTFFGTATVNLDAVRIEQGTTANSYSTIGATTLNGNFSQSGYSSTFNSATTINGTALVKTASATAFQVQNGSSVTILGVDTSASKIVSGIANGASAIGFALNTTNAFTTAGAKLLSVQNAGVEKFSISKDGDLAVSGSSVFSGNITVSGHIITGGTAPTTAVNANAGTGGTCVLSGNDTSGKITLTTGTGTVNGNVECTITFNGGFAATPKVLLSPGNGNASGMAIYADSSTVSTSSWQLSFGQTPGLSTPYVIYYMVVQ